MALAWLGLALALAAVGLLAAIAWQLGRLANAMHSIATTSVRGPLPTVGLSNEAAPTSEPPSPSRVPETCPGPAPTLEALVDAAIQRHDLAEANRLIAGASPEMLSTPLQERLNRATATKSAELFERLAAARSANDPDSVLEIHGLLVPFLAGETRREHDRDLVQWFMRILMRRMRAGTVQTDVSQLAERVASTFATTVEGASLKASIPTLRRSAGLCPVCSSPYKGVEAACPKCLAPTPAPDNEPETHAPTSEPPQQPAPPPDRRG